MGMTIEEAIKYYENKNVVLTEEEALANTIALNTMRKYQKIEKIVNNTFQNIAKEDERYAYEWLGDIKEVLEDATN